MLSHYSDLKAIPQAEITQSEVLSVIIQTLHRHLLPYEGRIGIGFPAYGQHRTLGGIVRVFGNEADICKLVYQLQNNKLSDYALIGNAQPIPDQVHGYLRYSRHQIKGNSDLTRARKRLAQQGLSEAEIQQRLYNKVGKTYPVLPHVHLHSQSSGQKFLLSIREISCKEAAQGGFGSYGLSPNATVPKF